jgi:hypothetical protein
MIAIAPGSRPHPQQVGSGARLAHRNSQYGLAGNHARQPALFLLFAGIICEVRGDDRIVQWNGEIERVLYTQSLDENGLEAEVGSCATITLGQRDAEEARLTGTAPGRRTDRSLVSPATRLGRPAMRIQEPIDAVLEEPELLIVHEAGSGEINSGHAYPPCWPASCAHPRSVPRRSESGAALLLDRRGVVTGTKNPRWTTVGCLEFPAEMCGTLES